MAASNPPGRGGASGASAPVFTSSARHEQRSAEQAQRVGDRWHKSTGVADAGRCALPCAAEVERYQPTDAAAPTPKKRRRRSGPFNLWAYIQRISDGCWPWTGYVNRDGYGRFGKNYTLAHRAVWELVNGPIPAGAVIRHSCDNPLCCNPDHLLSGSHADNTADKCARNRQAKGESNGQAKLSAEAVLAIRKEYVPRVVMQKDLARRYGVSESMVQKIVLGKYWKHLA